METYFSKLAKSIIWSEEFLICETTLYFIDGKNQRIGKNLKINFIRGTYNFEKKDFDKFSETMKEKFSERLEKYGFLKIDSISISNILSNKFYYYAIRKIPENEYFIKEFNSWLNKNSNNFWIVQIIFNEDILKFAIQNYIPKKIVNFSPFLFCLNEKI